jgi:hypothetical protein
MHWNLPFCLMPISLCFDLTTVEGNTIEKFNRARVNTGAADARGRRVASASQAREK